MKKPAYRKRRKPPKLGVPAEHLDLNGFTPFLIGAISNKWNVLSSRTYLKLFGIGMTEWRVLGSLGAKGSSGSASANEIVSLLGIDAAGVSRAMAKLEVLGHVTEILGTYPGRTRPYAMTPSGAALFDQVRELALHRERVLLQDLCGDERNLLLLFLRKLHARLPELQEGLDIGSNSENFLISPNPETTFD
ncbi:MarR family winged helix-turn-helix transcriptional regulator [Pseudomonas sp. MDT1-16]